MLSLLTSYLLRFKQVAIPAIGKFSLETEPAKVNFGDKVLLPPAIVIRYEEAVEIPEGQLSYLASQLDVSPDEIHNKLHAFGNGLRSVLTEGSFRWNGIGELGLAGNKIAFQSLLPQPLQPVAAQKVIRDYATHFIRQGEDQVESSFQQPAEKALHKKSNVEWLAWLLVVLALLFILFCFYQNSFSLHTTGLRKGATQNVFYQNR